MSLWKVARPCSLAAMAALAACGDSAASPAPTSGSAAPAGAAGASVSTGSPSATAKASPARSAAATSGSAAATVKPAASAGAAALKPVAGKLNITYAQISASFLPLIYANDAGTFKKNGVDAAVELAESSTGMAALLAGQIDMATTGGTELLDAASQGADVVSLANLVPVYTYVLEVQKDISSAQDLKGKKVGITRFGSVIDVATRVAHAQQRGLPKKG